jgi:magnesium-dependent phosphatase 1
MRALQRFHAGEYPGMRIAAASSADTPLAVRIGRSALDVLEIFPGVTAREAFSIGWPAGFEGNLQIGRTPPLSSDKAATHFPILRRETGIAYDEMLFFDDCNWGDHCGAVARGCVEARSGEGPVVVRTPRGLGIDEWELGLERFRQRVEARAEGATRR